MTFIAQLIKFNHFESIIFAQMTTFSKNELVRGIQSKFAGGDTVFLAIGIIAIIAGILVDLFVLRLLCLLVVVGSAVLLYSSIRAHQLQFHSASNDLRQASYPQPESQTMKKLIFDDLQHDPKKGFRVAEETDDHAVPAEMDRHVEPVPLSQTSVFAGQRHHSTLKSEHHIPREFQLSDFFDIDSTIYQGEAEPRTEFDFLLSKMLGVIKEVFFAQTVVFFWANRDKHQMIMETHLTDSADFFTTRRFPIGHDLVSKVALTGKPELVSEVNPLSESELFPYYATPSSVKSFVCVPIFYQKKNTEDTVDVPVAVLAVDSKAQDEFGDETLSLLGQFTKLISALIKTYNDKYDLLLDAELLNSIRRLQERIRNNFSLNTIVQSLGEETSKLVSWDFLSIVLYDELKHAWVAKKIINRAREGYIVTEQAIDFPQSIVGQTIRSNVHSFHDDLELVTFPRYFSEETLEKKGSFMCIPISSLNKCYGAISLESREKYNFSRHDLEMVYRLAENVASALEISYMQEVINEYVIIDNMTGMYSKKFFMQRTGEELQRADDSGADLSLLFVTIDKAEEISQRFGNDSYERVILTLAKAIRSSVRPYDLVGRYDTDRFGILLIGTAANDAHLWAEKIRKTIAGLVINLDSRSFSMTISIGVAGALEGMKKEELVGNTIAVLNTAIQGGGNSVRVF